MLTNFSIICFGEKRIFFKIQNNKNLFKINNDYNKFILLFIKKMLICIRKT